MAVTGRFFTLDDQQLYAFDTVLAQVGRVMDKATTKRILRIALTPALTAFKQEVPVSTRVVRGTSTFSTRRGKLRRDGTYDKGGALKRDARILMVKPVGDESARGLVGISKGRGKSGWRAIFVLRGTKARRTGKGANRGLVRPNDYAGRALTRSQPAVEAAFGSAAETLVTKDLKRYT